MTNITETWRDIPDLEYSVSSLGRVASRKYGKWRIMRPGRDNWGYLYVSLCENGVHSTRKLAGLVAEAFLGNRPTKEHQANHKNGVKTDNRADNLEWVTPSENVRHSYRVLGNRAARGPCVGTSKLTEDQVREIRKRLASGEFQKSIADDYGVDQVNVSHIKTGKSWAWLS